MLLETLTLKELEELKKDIKTVVIPVGSVEAHGPHLPFATDLYTVYEICKLLTKKKKILIAPPFYYGVCRSTSHFLGTISLKTEVLKMFLINILSEFYRHGFKNFVILSGHAGTTHTACLIDAAETFVNLYPYCKFFVANLYEILKPKLKEFNISEEDSHAGDWETSLMMFLKPEVVKEKGFEDYPNFPKFRVVFEKEKFWKSGIWGNPNLASKEKGEKLVQSLVEYLVQEIEKLEDEPEELCF